MSLDALRRSHFPHCLQQLSDDSYVMLNSYYEPIGFKAEEFVKYEDYPIAFRLKGVPMSTLEALSCKDDFNEECIFLYDESCPPEPGTPHLAAYLAKVEVLMGLSAES